MRAYTKTSILKGSTSFCELERRWKTCERMTGRNRMVGARPSSERDWEGGREGGVRVIAMIKRPTCPCMYLNGLFQLCLH